MNFLWLRARRLWREYTRMRTAIFFLIGVVLIVLVGSFVPQQDTSQQAKVDEFLASHAHLAALAARAGLPLTEVFVSPMFLTLLGSLYLALGACVIRRGRALVTRTLRRRPRGPQYWGEWGSWLFHTSFFLMLIAVVWGKSTGYQGIVTLTEGERVTESRSSYDQIQEGVLFSGRHAGYQVQLNHFTATYGSNGVPSDFVSNVTVYDHGRAVETRDLRVNEPLSYGNVSFYQQDYGWAPHVVVRNPNGIVVFDGHIHCFTPPGGASGKSVGAGILKVPDFGYRPGGMPPAIQLGANLAIFPDAAMSVAVGADGAPALGSPRYVPGGQEARNPVLEVQLMLGDLQLTAAQNVNSIDTAKMVPYFEDRHPLAVPMGGTLSLPLKGGGDMFTVSFPDVKQYSLFMVKRDDGVPLVYLTFGLIMSGLMAKLYIKPAMERLRDARHRRGDTEPADQLDLVGRAMPADHVDVPPEQGAVVEPTEPVGSPG